MCWPPSRLSRWRIGSPSSRYERTSWKRLARRFQRWRATSPDSTPSSGRTSSGSQRRAGRGRCKERQSAPAKISELVGRLKPPTSHDGATASHVLSRELGKSRADAAPLIARIDADDVDRAHPFVECVQGGTHGFRECPPMLESGTKQGVGRSAR